MVVEWYKSIDSPSVMLFFFSSRRRHTRFDCDWSSDVCSSDLTFHVGSGQAADGGGALLITQEVVAHHTATDVIAALRAHRVPERLRGAGRKIGRASCRERG